MFTKEMFKQSIKTNILSIFISLMITISLLILSSQYYFNRQLAIDSAQKAFKHLALNTANRLDNASKRITNFLTTNIENPNFKEMIDFTPKHPIYHDFTQMMKVDSGIYAMYFTHSNGAFYEVINMRGAKNLYKLYKAPKNTRWIVIISLSNKRQYAYIDRYAKVLSKFTTNEIYNPLTRPWYLLAINSNKTIATKPYTFSNLKKDGITFATKLDTDGSVFAIDYTLKNISKILQSQKSDKNLELFIFNKNGEVDASSIIGHKKVDNEIMKKISKNNIQKIIKYKKDSKNYFAIYKKLKYSNNYLGITLNVDKLFYPYIENLKRSFSLSIIFIILSIPIIFFVTNIIVKPIKALITENEKIKNRDFSEVINIKTNILEFIELSNSFVTMSKSIQEYQKSQEKLLDSIVKLIAEAVDAKSPYTGGHCKRVPEIAQMLLDQANKSNDEVFKGFNLETKDELREFEIAAWLHDCGKVTTPEYVVDKATKLETIYNRIHEIRTRFEVLWRDSQIKYLQSQLNNKNKETALKLLNFEQKKLIDDFHFIATTNIGGEYMSEDKKNRINKIANIEWQRNFDDSLGLGEMESLRYAKEVKQKLPATEKLLSDKKLHIVQREFFDFEAYKKNGFKEEVPKYLYNYGEIYNLSIEKGTLTPEERYKINEHVIMSIKMLEKIPFPLQMTKVPEYAGTHHETLIGTGYPRQLKKDELSIPARIMALSDIFEALTASDRPYKKAKTLSESIKIMSYMVKDKHIDKDLFKLFLKSGLYITYAKKHLKANQIDEVDIEIYLN